MLCFHSHSFACFGHHFSHPVAVLLISFQTALSSGFSVLSLSHLASCLGTVISVAVSEMYIHQENNQATSYISKKKQSFLRSYFHPQTWSIPQTGWLFNSPNFCSGSAQEAATSGCAMGGKARTVCVSMAAREVFVSPQAQSLPANSSAVKLLITQLLPGAIGYKNHIWMGWKAIRHYVMVYSTARSEHQRNWGKMVQKIPSR